MSRTHANTYILLPVFGYQSMQHSCLPMSLTWIYKYIHIF
ncbi:hypothetical protein HMPREF9406_0605 [Clostridium sp. HGF2]|nr:hypothetical protein HMPREF9406_0605 [Clostridium sp. HGF2]EQJ58549.1 hypothetical protein QSI_1830 [Clostridioides difficile P28]